MDCYVINLDRSRDRLDQMYREFDRLNLKFTRVSAVDGQKLPDDLYTRHAERRQLSRPQIGVLLSHQKCWDLFSKSGADYCAIFEDDVHLSDDLPEIFDSIEINKPKFDILKIETARKKILISRNILNIIASRKIRKIGSYHVGAAGYIVNRNGLAKILKFKKEADTVPVDEFLFEFLLDHADIFQIDPALAIQDQAEGVIDRTNLKSLIANQVDPRNQSILKKIFKELRRPIKKILLNKFGLKLLYYKRKKIDFI
jgi:glycosyl transferase family 25